MLCGMDATLWDTPVLNVMFAYMCFYRYKDALVLLLREVLNRIQFRYNQAQLEELDDETLDDDVRTFYTVSLASDNFLFVRWLLSSHQKPKTWVTFFLFFGGRLQQQTEWQRYLRQSLEVIAKVMELLPSHAFSTLVRYWHFLSAPWQSSISLEFLLSHFLNIHL